MRRNNVGIPLWTVLFLKSDEEERHFYLVVMYCHNLIILYAH